MENQGGKHESYQKSFVSIVTVRRFGQRQQAPFANNGVDHCICHHATKLLPQKHWMQQRSQRLEQQLLRIAQRQQLVKRQQLLLWRYLLRPKRHLTKLSKNQWKTKKETSTQDVSFLFDVDCINVQLFLFPTNAIGNHKLLALAKQFLGDFRCGGKQYLQSLVKVQ